MKAQKLICKIIRKIDRDYGIHIFPDKIYLKALYYLGFGKKLNLNSPETFNDKLQWLKLYERDKRYINLVDKCEVKKNISKLLGEKYIIPTLGVWDNFEDIDFECLPQQFVLKCTHDSGGVVICKDKSTFDRRIAQRKLEKSLKKNFYFIGREWPYKFVKPRIIAEEYMEDSSGELRDYKFFCFNGKVKCFKIDFDRQTRHRANYYDKEGKLLYFGEEICEPDWDREIELPVQLKKMIFFAEKISKENKFLRVDFYEIAGELKFGELTFYPASGFGKFIPEEWDYVLGGWLEL